MASTFTTKDIRAVTLGMQCLSLITCDYTDGTVSKFVVLVFDEEDGYVFSKEFATEELGNLCFEAKEQELRATFPTG